MMKAFNDLNSEIFMIRAMPEGSITFPTRFSGPVELFGSLLSRSEEIV